MQLTFSTLYVPTLGNETIRTSCTPSKTENPRPDTANRMLTGREHAGAQDKCDSSDSNGPGDQCSERVGRSSRTTYRDGAGHRLYGSSELKPGPINGFVGGRRNIGPEQTLSRRGKIGPQSAQSTCQDVR